MNTPPLDPQRASGPAMEGAGGPAMNISRPFIMRPVGTSLLMAAIMLVGTLALGMLPISALPNVEYPTIEVRTFYAGASPEVMTSAVTAPLERQFGQMAGLSQMLSTSSAGASIITLQFDLGFGLDVAEQEVQAAINAAGTLLPGDLPAPPIYAKVNPADAPVLTLAVSSATLPLSQVEDVAETRLAQKLSQLPGVGMVGISGGQRPAVRVRVNPMALAAHGLNLDDLRTTLANSNQNAPKGGFDGSSRSYSINANDQIQSATGFRDAVIAYRNGAPVRLGDVASVIDAAENTALGAWMNRTPAVILNIQRQPGANVIAVVDRALAMLPELGASLPAQVTVTPLTDRTTTIRASVRDVAFELALAVALVVLVLLAFLRDIRATLIPSLAVPLSLVGTLAFMYLAGFSLDNLSLMALTIATGFVVDDAIVMIENIARLIEAGESRMNAALRGARQIGFTIISLTVSLIAVLIPLLFMGDVIGRLFREFAMTLAVTIIISAVVSLTLVPMMCARMLRTGHRAHADTRAGRRLRAGYDRALGFVLDHQGVTLAVAGLTFVATCGLYVEIPKGLFPPQDTNAIQGISEAAPSISYRAMAEHQQALADILLRDPDVVSLSSFIGVDGTNATLNQGRFLINLRAREERRASETEILQRLQRAVAGVPGITLFLRPMQELSLDAAVSPTQYRFVLQGTDLAVFDTWVPNLLARLREVPEITDVASDLAPGGMAARIEIDRATAARFGITPATIDNALYDAFGQRIISTIFTQASQYRVILETDPALPRTIASLGDIRLPSATAPDGQVPLSAIATITEGRAPLRINHMAQFPASTVSFNLAAGVSLGAAVTAVEATAREVGLPGSLTTSFQGAALAFQASLNNELLLILAAIVTMYIVLGVLYESFVHPLTILSTLPSAGVGALLALMLAGRELDIMGIIGIVLLIGIVKKNAIMMVDFALAAEREGGETPRAAIHQAALMRLRPILMTTLAALLAALPLMLATGTGAELRQPLGLAIVGGLIVSQVLTLFTTPVIYLVFDRLVHGPDRGRAAAGRLRPGPAAP